MSAIIAAILIFLGLKTAIRVYSESFCIHSWKHARKLISGVIGAAIVVIFVHFLRDIYREIEMTNPLLVLSIPIGFIAIMYIERHIHHHKNKKQELTELIEMNSIVSGIIAFFVGIIAVTNIQDTLEKEIIFLIILIIYGFVHDITLHMLHHIKRQPHKGPLWQKMLRSSIPCLGAAVAFIFHIPQNLSTTLLGLISGTFMYIIAREILPHDRTSVPRYFLLGAFSVAALFVLDFYVIG